MKRQYKGLDIAKFFFSWVVVAIHTELLLDTPAVYRPLMRYFMSAAVPVFFIISGFLCGNKYLDSDRRPEVIRKSVKSLLRLYGIWGGDVLSYRFTEKRSVPGKYWRCASERIP